MIPFHSLLPEVAQREVRTLQLQAAAETSGSLSSGEYAFVELYCEDLACDCRRVFIQVIARHQKDQVLASINYGWEDESFYRKRMPHNPEAPRQVVRGCLDPMNTQSVHSQKLLDLFQRYVLDEPYRLRLRRHYQLFREELRRQNSIDAADAAPPGVVRAASSEPTSSRTNDARIPRYLPDDARIEDLR
jgi:hypothetical protein